MFNYCLQWSSVDKEKIDWSIISNELHHIMVSTKRNAKGVIIPSSSPNLPNFKLIKLKLCMKLFCNNWICAEGCSSLDYQHLQRWAKKRAYSLKLEQPFFKMIKTIANFTSTCWDKYMWIINNKYRSVCRPSTSITRRSLGLNVSIHLSMISCEILFRSLTMTSFKESR